MGEQVFLPGHSQLSISSLEILHRNDDTGSQLTQIPLSTKNPGENPKATLSSAQMECAPPLN